MKKTLMTSLFCAAITLSSLVGIKSNKQCNAEQQANNENIIFPLSPRRKINSPISEFKAYSDNGVEDDVRNGATVVRENKVSITGRIDKHSWFDQFVHLITEIDRDWYTFSITENYKYEFDFTAPNSGYKCYLYKYRGESTLGTGWGTTFVHKPDGEMPNEAIFTLSGSGTKYAMLNPGTYYLAVTVDSGDSIVSDSYNILFEQVNYSGRDTTTLLTEEMKASNAMALWENDMLPDNATRWISDEQQLRSWTPFSSYPVRMYQEIGYVDPIYDDDERYLDSVLYIWDKDVLSCLKYILDGVQLSLFNAIEQFNANYEDVRKIKVDFEPWAGFSVDIVFEIAGYIPVVRDIIQIPSTIRTVAEDINEIATYSANFIVDNIREILNENIFGAGGFYQGIRSACNTIEMLSQYEPDAQRAVCIPRYARVTKRTITEFGKPDDKQSYWTPSFDGIDMAYRSYYLFEDSSISSVQTVMIGNEQKSFHGKVTTFATGDDFLDYTGFDYRECVNHYNPEFGNYRILERKQPLSELEFYFDSSNDYMNDAGFMFEQSGRVMFFTRSPNPTRIEIYDESDNLLKAGGNGGIYHGNAFVTFNVEAFKRYRVEVTMTPTYESSCYGYLDVIQQPNSYGYYGDINHIEHDFEEDILKIEGAGLEAFLGFEQGYTAVYSFVPEISAAYILSTYYSKDYYTYFLPMSGVSCDCYSCSGSGVHNADYLWLNKDETCLVVVARKDRFAALGNNGYYGLMIDVRYISEDSYL